MEAIRKIKKSDSDEIRIKLPKNFKITSTNVFRKAREIIA